ncbi:unnamed protein product, partial [Brugia timori]|uniref:DHO_dh domain-containing protein n=1 Tax=Brugia timori TaxID=42155 RepID=A0A0R3R2B2_9BILA
MGGFCRLVSMNRRLSSNYCTTVCQKSGVEVLRDFSWSAKLVGDCDTALGNLRPIVVLTLHFIEGATRTYEFTVEEKMYPKLSPGYITKSTAIILSSSTFLYGFMEYITGNEVFQRKQLPCLGIIQRHPSLIIFFIFIASHSVYYPNPKISLLCLEITLKTEILWLYFQLMPLLNCILRPELTVRFNIYLAKHRLLPLFSHSYREHSELNCNVMNMHFKNPLGLAAGFDKDAEAIKGLRESGFGFIEVGTVTPLPQKDAHNSVVKLLFKDEVSFPN